jgi:nicotinamide mononucleotide transporter
LQISRASRRELVSSIAFAVVATGGLWQVLAHTGSHASFLDALTTSISLAAQWLLNRKRLESWIGWILVDIIYIPLYLSKGLTLTAILYAVFLIMAVLGYREWLQMWRSQHPEESSPLQTVQAR